MLTGDSFYCERMPARLHRLALPALAALSLAGCAAQSATTAPSLSARSATTSGVAAPKPTRPSSQRPSGTTATAAGQLALITEPEAGVAPVLSALRGARHQVEMVMYEDEDSQVNAALAADERRGVKVRVLLNSGYYGEGSAQNQAAYSYLQARSVPVKWTPSYFALTHQKTLLVDGRAYILTFNLTPQYYASGRDFGVIDTTAADERAVQQTFNADWSGQRITAPKGADLLWSPGSEQAQVSLIESAQGFLDIYNEEMDSTAIEQALEADAKRGVNVEVTMTYDSSWKDAFAQLSAAGVHIRTYSASAPLYIHAKMILTPSRAFLGSQNFSSTSLEKNRELGLITSNPTIRASLRRTFDADYACRRSPGRLGARNVSSQRTARFRKFRGSRRRWATADRGASCAPTRSVAPFTRWLQPRRLPSTSPPAGRGGMRRRQRRRRGNQRAGRSRCCST